PKRLWEIMRRPCPTRLTAARRWPGRYCRQGYPLRGGVMAARSMASLTISFGMVAIPVDLYTTTVSGERISFNLLHAKDGSRVRQQYVCVKEGKVVERSELTKGYEFAKDQYVMFSAEELKALDEVGTNSVDIVE